MPDYRPLSERLVDEPYAYAKAAADLIDFLSAEVERLRPVAEAARRWRENARPAVAVVKAATFDDVQAMSEKAARFGDALAAALDALEDQQPAAVQEPTEETK